MKLIKDFSDLHIRVDIYLYLLLLQTERNINNYTFFYVFVSCFATRKRVPVLQYYVILPKNKTKIKQDETNICFFVSNQQ